MHGIEIILTHSVMNISERFRYIPPVTKNLLIINTVIYIAMALIPQLNFNLEKYGALYYFTSDQFLPSQLISYMFIHASFWHLFFNMFSLWMFGELIERTMGSPRYLFYYISCGLGAALIQEGIFALMINHYADLFANGDALCRLMSGNNVTYGDVMALGINPGEPAVRALAGLYHTPTVGASGAIYGILLAFGFLYPNIRLYLLFPPIPMRARTAVLVFAGIELALGVYNSQADTVAHFAHLGGMLFGLAILLWWKKNGTMRKIY